ncbi:hypothetical protein GGX14DRAFT_405940 [Mycena pura]|uniref:Myb/SANT-like domain-containing protein n=1 Tax=Mycena pura TaxID=153505 RepID=A0AAD6XYM7_9AGAR|nr:hypothetical protein GGX14DRAFT_405940 [Mycena pura]
MPSDKTWTNAQAQALLDALLEKRLTHQSGNGWKPSVWSDVVAAVNAVDPESQKTSTQLSSRQLKGVYEDYQYVLGFSGTGWDDHGKHATNTEEYVEDFIRMHGEQYKRCFKKPCPYYDKLDELYDGAKNRATGEHVLLLGKKKKKTSTAQTKASKKSAALKASKMTTATANKENVNFDAGMLDARDGPSTPRRANEERAEGDEMDIASDDELLVSPVKTKRTRAESDNDDDADRPARRRSKPGSSGSAQRNADAGFAMASSIEALSSAIAEPVVLKTDLSHVDNIVSIFETQPDLLPNDPDGLFYDTVTQALSENEGKARIFIATKDAGRRRGIINGILRKANLVNL